MLRVLSLSTQGLLVRPLAGGPRWARGLGMPQEARGLYPAFFQARVYGGQGNQQLRLGLNGPGRAPRRLPWEMQESALLPPTAPLGRGRPTASRTV